MNSMSPTDQRQPPPIAEKIAEDIAEHFKSNLVGILLYGSSQWSEKYWDLDIILILERNDLKIDNLEILRQVQKKFNEHTLDLQLVYRHEIENPDIFSLDAHGAFFSQILKRALVLRGENPFIDATPDKRLFLVSIITRIQRYVFQARQEYIGNRRFNKDRNPTYHKKHILRMMFDILFMRDQWIETKEILPYFIERFPKVLDNHNLSMLDSGSDSIDDYIVLYEKVYRSALDESINLLRG